MRTQRGGSPLLFVVCIALLCAWVLAALTQHTAGVYQSSLEQERRIRTRSVADINVQVLKGRARSGSVPLPLSFSVNQSGVTGQGTAFLAPERPGLVRITQTLNVGGRPYDFVDHVGLPTGAAFIAWSERLFLNDNLAGASDFFSTNLGRPDFQMQNMATSAGGATAASYGSFSWLEEFSGSRLSAILGSNGLNLTTAQFLDYDFIIFVVEDGTNSNINDCSVEFSRGSQRITIGGGSTAGIYRRTQNASNYQSTFAGSALPFGNNTVVTAILFDFDAISGAGFLKAIAGPLNATLYYPGSGTAPYVDAMGTISALEPEDPKGLLLEASPVVRAIGDAYNAVAFENVVLRRVSVPPSVGVAGTTNMGIGAPSDFKFAIWSGMLNPPSTGTYQFRITTDDGVRLYVNDVQLFTSWWGQAPATYTTNSINLTAGVPVRFAYEFWDGWGLESYLLEWKTPTNSNWTQVPYDVFTPSGGTVPIYSNRFETNSTTGWTFSGLRTTANGASPSGNTTPGANGISWYPDFGTNILGDFGPNGWAELSLANTPAGRYVVFFDFVTMYTWDYGSVNGFFGWEQDLMIISQNGTQLLSRNPHTAWYELGETTSAGLPFFIGRSGVSRPMIRFEVDHPGGTLTLRIASGGAGLQEINDESFAIDNFYIKRKLL